MKAVYILLAGMFFLTACGGNGDISPEQLVEKQEATISALRGERDNMDGKIRLILVRLNELSAEEDYLQEAGNYDGKNMEVALARIQQAIEVSVNEIRTYRENTGSAVNELNQQLAQLERQLREREAELEQYKKRLETNPTDAGKPPKGEINIPLYIETLEAELYHTKQKLGATMERNENLQRRNAGLSDELQRTEATQRITVDSLNRAIATAKRELVKIEKEKNEKARKYESEVRILEEKLEREKAKVYVSIAREMSREMDNVKKSKGRRGEFCEKVISYYEKAMACECGMREKVSAEYERVKRDCE